MEHLTRREFLATMGITVAAGGLVGWSLQEAMAQPIERLAENVPKAILGRTGFPTKILGLGAMYYLVGEKPTNDVESDRLLNTALDLGVNIFEIGRSYADAEVRIGRVVGKRRDDVFLSSKSTKRTKERMLKDIETSLANLRTDYLDLYHLHDCSSILEYEKATGKDGALEGLKQAQKEGKIRFIGITSHSVQAMMTALRSGEFDVFIIPYNAMSRDFERALNLAAKLNAGVLCMKPLGGFRRIYNPEDRGQLHDTLPVEECLRFVLSHPGVTVAIPGSGTVEYLKQNLSIAATFRPITEDERKDIIARADRIAGGVCVVCEEKPCEKVCQNQVPISFLLSKLQHRKRFYYDRRWLGDQYAVLSHDYLDCDECGKCEKACPQKFNIRDDMKEAHELMVEVRARVMLLS